MPAGSAHQITVLDGAQRPSPRVIVVVVDDAPTDFARAMRERVAQDFVATYESSYLGSWASCRHDRDPAVWYPAERRALVVSPSRPLGEQIASYTTHPGLAWNTERYTAAEAQAWSQAVAAEIVGVETELDAPYRPLEAQAHTLRLLLGQQSPASEDEQLLIDGLPPHAVIEVYLATTRDDESPNVPSEYRVSEGSAEYGMVFAPDPTFTSCDLERVPFIQEWSGFEYGSCEAADFFGAGGGADCFGRCLPRPPLVSENGSAACRILAFTDSELPCSAELGWVDPISEGARRALTTERNGVTSRICEVLQLEGAALDSCRSDLACSECQPGWCATNIPDLWTQCYQSGVDWPFRYPFGTATGRGAEFEIICNTE